MGMGQSGAMGPQRRGEDGRERHWIELRRSGQGKDGQSVEPRGRDRGGTGSEREVEWPRDSR